MRINNFILAVLVIISLSLITVTSEFTSAADSTMENSQIIKTGTASKVMVVCQNDGHRCSSSSTGNITIFYPNSSILIDNQNMTYTLNYFYYPLNSNQTLVLGKYTASGTFTDGSIIAPFTFDFYITQTGNIQSTSQGMNSIAYLFLMIALTFIFGFMAFKFAESDTLWVLGIFLFVLALLMVVYDVWLGFEYRINYVGADNNGSIPQTLFIILMVILGAGFISALIFTIIKWDKLVRFFKSAIKEEKDDDGWDNNNFDSFNK